MTSAAIRHPFRRGRSKQDHGYHLVIPLTSDPFWREVPHGAALTHHFGIETLTAGAGIDVRGRRQEAEFERRQRKATVLGRRPVARARGSDLRTAANRTRRSIGTRPRAPDDESADAGPGARDRRRPQAVPDYLAPHQSHVARRYRAFL